VAAEKLKFKQIAIGQWQTGNAMTYSVIGLSEQGDVYKSTVHGWVPIDGVLARGKSPAAVPRGFNSPANNSPAIEEEF